MYSEAIALNTTSTEGLPASSIAFPLRIEHGLLRRTDERDAYLTIIAVMARTPRGSWPGHSGFGFNELFPEITNPANSPESRQRLLQSAVQQINGVLADLGLTRYQLESFIPDAVDPQAQSDNRSQWIAHVIERRGITAILREAGAHRVIEYAL
jgi:hypothetical protein